MGKLYSNKAVGDLQGTVGGLVYVHRADGSVIVRRLAESHAPFTEPQRGSQRRFAQAQHYAKVLKASPEQYAPYKIAASIRRERACDLAISDFMKLPSVNEIDLSHYTGHPAELIVVEAIDQIEVIAVSLTLARLDGVLIEQGMAVPDETCSLWTYVTQTTAASGQTVVIHVTATDRPGNAVSKTVHLALVL